jgi:hypothetical protein
MKMINVLNKLTELSKENTSPDVKQALESTRKINGDANLQVIEEHIVEGRIDDLNDRRAAKKRKSKKHKDKAGTKEKPRMVKGHRYGGSKQKDDDDREDLDESDELARRADLRAKSGEGILTKRKYGPEYKAHMRNKKNLKQDPYKIAGPKGALPESEVQEVITKKTPAGEIISDFQKSKNPKFKGKSKAKRKDMALGAYYGMHPEKSKVKETAMTPKQKKFAALAKPTNKITYADKIAGARKNTGVKETKLTPKQMKIAKAAKPTNAITGADFAALRKGRKVESALVREGTERKAKNLTESKMITETNDLVDLRKLAGLNECGMMGTTMGAHTPANISINASAASGSEVASMMRDLMRLAGGETSAHVPEIAVMDGAACGGMEEMVDESEQDGHFADATTEPAEQVFDENPVVSMTGKQVQTPNGNARQNDNPLEESLWKKYQAQVNEGFDPESFEGSTDVTWIGDDGEEVEGYVNYIATPDPQTGHLHVKLTGGAVTGNNIAAKVDDHMIQYLITDPDYSAEYQQAAEQDAQAQWDSRDAKQHDLGDPAAM